MPSWFRWFWLWSRRRETPAEQAAREDRRRLDRVINELAQLQIEADRLATIHEAAGRFLAAKHRDKSGTGME